MHILVFLLRFIFFFYCLMDKLEVVSARRPCRTSKWRRVCANFWVPHADVFVWISASRDNMLQKYRPPVSAAATIHNALCLASCCCLWLFYAYNSHSEKCMWSREICAESMFVSMRICAGTRSARVMWETEIGAQHTTEHNRARCFDHDRLDVENCLHSGVRSLQLSIWTWNRLNEVQSMFTTSSMINDSMLLFNN